MKKYQIGPDPARIDPALIEGFPRVEVATPGHSRHRGFVDRRLRSLQPLPGTLVGTATCWSSTGWATPAMPVWAAAWRWTAPVTDPDEINECGLPVFCDGVSGTTTRLNDPGGGLNKPVSCGNVPTTTVPASRLARL